MITTTRLNKIIFCLILVSFFLLASKVKSQEPVKYFKQNCANCHSIGGGQLTGPDLKNTSERNTRDWFIKWITDPAGVLKSGDPYAIKLQKESKGAVMTLSPGMTKELAIALLDLIDEESKLEKSQFVGFSLSERPFIPEDIKEGYSLFTGGTHFENGAPACIGCHNVNGLNEFLGGGTLGLNLTNVFGKLGGRKALAAWLNSPAGVTMKPIFKDKILTDEEILSLVAFLKDETEKNKPFQSSNLINFLLMGLGGAIILAILFDLIWNFRLRSVRRKMVMDKKI